jgi:hypothetical protein
MTPQPTDRELGVIAEEVVLPTGIPVAYINLTPVSEATPGERLPTGDFAGKGGTFRWGVAWFDGRNPVKPPIHMFPEGVGPRASLRLIEIIRELHLEAPKASYLARLREAEAAEASAEAASARETATTKKGR